MFPPPWTTRHEVGSGSKDILALARKFQVRTAVSNIPGSSGNVSNLDSVIILCLVAHHVSLCGAVFDLTACFVAAPCAYWILFNQPTWTHVLSATPGTARDVCCIMILYLRTVSLLIKMLGGDGVQMNLILPYYACFSVRYCGGY